MSYSTQQDLVDRFGLAELERYAWDDDNDTLSTVQIQRALSDTKEVIDVYISQVVQLPLATVPAILVAISSDIARLRLQETSPLDEAKERHKEAMQLLKDMASGKAALYLPDQNKQGGKVYAQRGIDDRQFTRETLSSFSWPS